MTIGRILRRCVRRFARDERGVISAFNLFLAVTCCAVGAMALDVTRMYEARTHLQVMADVGAHAAIFKRLTGSSEADAKAAAVRVASDGVPTGYGPSFSGSTGPLLTAADVTFGTWNATATPPFTPLPTGSPQMPNAAQVVTNRADDNPVGSFLFRIIGLNSMNVRAAAIYTVVGDPCASMQGLFGVLQVSANGQNNYSNGICVHSQEEVDLQAHNDFTKDSVVSAPNRADVTCGNDCDNFELVRRSANRNLEPWLAPIRPVPGERPEDLLNQVRTALGSARVNGWLTTPAIQSYLGGYDVTPSSLVSGRATYIGCPSGGTLHLEADNKGVDIFSNVVLLTNCKIDLKGVTLSNSVIYTTNASGADRNPGDASVSIPRGAGGVTLGGDTTCSGDGYAAILTRGGFHGAAGLTFRGGEVRALQVVKTESHFDGKGVSIIAGGEINLASNSNLTACPPPPGAPSTVVNYQLVR